MAVLSCDFHVQELIDYLDTLIYVSPFYRADDHLVIAKLNDQYEYNLNSYAGITMDGLHDFIIRKKMSVLLLRFPHKDDEDYED